MPPKAAPKIKMPPKAAPKRKAANGYKLAEPLPKGEILEDVSKKKWKLGLSIGQGGFGEIYSAQEADSKSKDYPYVIKIEPHGNGPLFVEMHFYIRNSKVDDIEKFKAEKGLKTFGMPVYVGSGSHEHKGLKYRFVVMEKFGTDLWKIFLENNRIFPKTTVFKIAIQILDVLEYIHKRGYVHADIKGANILLGASKATQNKQVYLVDFGLATKITNETVFKPNPKKAHDGTIEYLSRDAHKGVPTRRGDLEILAYNMIQWLGCTLPWEKNLKDPTVVQKSKDEHMESTSKIIQACFGKQAPPDSLVKYLTYISSLNFDDVPKYKEIRDMFLKGLDSGDALGKPFEFVIKSKTPQKRKNKSPARKVGRKKLDNSEHEENGTDDMMDTSDPEVIQNDVTRRDEKANKSPARKVARKKLGNSEDEENGTYDMMDTSDPEPVQNVSTRRDEKVNKSPAKKVVRKKLDNSEDEENGTDDMIDTSDPESVENAVTRSGRPVVKVNYTELPVKEKKARVIKKPAKVNTLPKAHLNGASTEGCTEAMKEIMAKMQMKAKSKTKNIRKKTSVD